MLPETWMERKKDVDLSEIIDLDVYFNVRLAIIDFMSARCFSMLYANKQEFAFLVWLKKEVLLRHLALLINSFTYRLEEDLSKMRMETNTKTFITFL